jgi:hypothetical protein
VGQHVKIYLQREAINICSRKHPPPQVGTVVEVATHLQTISETENAVMFGKGHLQVFLQFPETTAGFSLSFEFHPVSVAGYG